MNRRTLGGWMIAAGVFCGAVGFVLWQQENDRYDKEVTTAEFTDAIISDNGGFGGYVDDLEKNQMPAYASWGIGALLFIGGIVLFAAQAQPAVSDGPVGPAPAGSAGGSAADEIDRLAAMRDAGTITAAEFDAGKRKALGLEAPTTEGDL